MTFKFETANERWQDYKESAEHPLLKKHDWPEGYGLGPGQGWDGNRPYTQSPEAREAAMVEKFLPQIQQKLQTLSGNELRELANIIYTNFK
jgi:hypothetical protein